MKDEVLVVCLRRFGRNNFVAEFVLWRNRRTHSVGIRRTRSSLMIDFDAESEFYLQFGGTSGFMVLCAVECCEGN
jgi:hypothetical protein